MSKFSTFPSTYSIPPASFYNMQGLIGWLNQNPTYKQYFINYPNITPGLSPIKSTMTNSTTSTSIPYNVQNAPLQPLVITMSYNQMQQYNSQIQLFRRVYEFNSNAYIRSLPVGGPIYYSFSSYKELMEYKASVGLVNKLYPFRPMAYGTNEAGKALNWIVPFPL